ncbi:hypothetical protein [Streptomyces fractus]|uniref:hypothetical protein n=1 Tax=Streptomyces fractus TaxID=641806 RepID=UPI003CFABA77
MARRGKKNLVRASGPPQTPAGGPVAGAGPRDYTLAEDPDENSFVPPESPKPPRRGVIARIANVVVLVSVVLIVAPVMFGWDKLWWLSAAGTVGAIAGLVVLFLRMDKTGRHDDTPGHGVIL